jgi:NADP-dependent 3-hydroxy acid dehydrogenase YdfG
MVTGASKGIGRQVAAHLALGGAGVANAADINFASSVAEQYGRYGVRIYTVNHG